MRNAEKALNNDVSRRKAALRSLGSILVKKADPAGGGCLRQYWKWSRLSAAISAAAQDVPRPCASGVEVKSKKARAQAA